VVSLKFAKSLRIVTGIVAANLVGIASCYALYFLSRILGRADTSSSMGTFAGMFVTVAIWPSLVLMPMAMGLVAAYFWRSLGFTAWQYLGWWLVSVLVSASGAFLFVHEGRVCLIIGSPILFVCGLAGVMVGGTIFRSNRATMNLSVIPGLFLMMLVEGGMRRDREQVVEDRMLIAASAENVWRHVVAFPRIETAPNYWLNKAGLPSPSETTCQGPFVGAQRECIFSGGLVFEEVVSEIQRAQLLTFEIVKQPSDPELLGHLTLHRGQFELVDNNNGTTTLIGRSWYTLHMRPNWYFDWWTRDVTSHVHLRVMEHIKALSESDR
jgi:hypothetical protein